MNQAMSYSSSMKMALLLLISKMEAKNYFPYHSKLKIICPLSLGPEVANGKMVFPASVKCFQVSQFPSK